MERRGLMVRPVWRTQPVPLVSRTSAPSRRGCGTRTCSKHSEISSDAISNTKRSMHFARTSRAEIQQPSHGSTFNFMATSIHSFIHETLPNCKVPPLDTATKFRHNACYYELTSPIDNRMFVCLEHKATGPLG